MCTPEQACGKTSGSASNTTNSAYSTHIPCLPMLSWLHEGTKFTRRALSSLRTARIYVGISLVAARTQYFQCRSR